MSRINLDPEERDRLVSALNSKSADFIWRQMESQIKEFEAVCESPIEILLGVALHHGLNALIPAAGRGKLIFLNDAARSRKPFLAAQWEIVPQFAWESYRIDFAIFVPALPYPIFIECDGHDFHERNKEQAARDREKDRKIQAAGIPILRFTGSEIYAAPMKRATDVYRFVSARAEAIQAAPVAANQFIPSTAAGWLVRRGGAGKRAHIWTGQDTVCRMWSTGGMSQAKYEVTPEMGARRVCEICKQINGRVTV